MKTVDVFAMKEERVQRAGQILIVGRLLHALGPVVRYELHPLALSSNRERPLCLQLSWPLFLTWWPLFLTIRQRPWDSASPWQWETIQMCFWSLNFIDFMKY